MIPIIFKVELSFSTGGRKYNLYNWWCKCDLLIDLYPKKKLKLSYINENSINIGLDFVKSPRNLTEFPLKQN